MQVNMENITTYISVILAGVAMIRVLIIAPFNSAIGKLESTLVKMDEKLENYHMNIVRLDESVKSAHKRIDEHISKS